MKILFITARLPLPGTKGDALRSFHFIRDLSHEHEVDVISFVESRNELAQVPELEKHCRSVKAIYLPRVWALMKMLIAIFSLTPFQVVYYSSARMEVAIRKALGRDYDVVHITPARMMSYRECIRNVPLVVDLVDSLSLNMRRRALREKLFVKKLLFHFESWKMARYEEWVTKQYDHGAITSDVDRRAIRGNHISVVPNGVDTGRFAPRPESKAIDTIFTGNMNYYPNVDAATNFATEIFPRIRKRKEETNFYIVGANPSRSIEELRDEPKTFVTGFVPDIVEYLNRAKVFVAPLQVGSGIQNKILEAMACGIPVVSTSRGNAAIGARDGEEILIAETPQEFASKVDTLLADERYRNDLGDRGRDYVRKRFGWMTQSKKLLATYQKAVHSHEMKVYERSTGRVPIYYYDRTRQDLENRNAIAMNWFSPVSRLLDIVLATLGIVLSSPLWLLAVAAVKVQDGGPIFYRQKRVGLGSRAFGLLKFRTMVEDAESGTAQFCQEGDCRVTPIGRLLRRTRIDELPQFLNVLKGEMSLIGPRPERPEFVSGFEKQIPLYGQRHRVKPGLTGWAQVNFPYASSVEDTIRKLQYDLYYIKNRSLLMDLSILLQTVSVVLTGKGAR